VSNLDVKHEETMVRLVVQAIIIVGLFDKNEIVVAAMTIMNLGVGLH